MPPTQSNNHCNPLKPNQKLKSQSQQPNQTQIKQIQIVKKRKEKTHNVSTETQDIEVPPR